jgi:hypothetical protein
VRKIYPAVGEFTVYYVRDGDQPITPSPADLLSVRDRIPTPAEIPESSIHVEAPVEKSIAFDFTSITPDSTAMRLAIESSLAQFFRETATLGWEQPTLAYNQYIKPILTAVNLATGESLQDFVLNTVNGVAPADIAVADTELPTLGNITYV